MIKKRLICVFLVVLILLSATIEWCIVFVVDKYVRDFKYIAEDNGWGYVLSEYPLNEYLSKSPSWYYPDISLSYGEPGYPYPPKLYDHVEYLFGFTCPYYVKYKSNYINILGQTSVYKFSVKERICLCDFCLDDTKSLRVCFELSERRSDLIFFSENECTLAFFEKGFERNKEYIIFPWVYSFIEKNTNILSKCEFKEGIFAIGYLDEEYPYIEFYPSLIRCDATYFGAETPYVSKEVFVQYIKDNWYRGPTPSSTA